jgi:hypothetical protein
MTDRKVYEVREEQLQALAAAGAREGARQVLSHLGLDDETASSDLRDLRDLLGAWRDARRVAWRTTVKVITTGILAILLAGTAIKLKLGMN